MADSTKPKPITKAEYDDWLTPQRALERVASALNGNWNTVHQSILRRAASGKLRVHAEDIDWECGSRSGSLPQYSAIPDGVLKGWGDSDHSSRLPFWNGVDGEWEVRTGHSLQDRPIEWKMFGIRFDPAGLDKMAGTSKAATPAAPVVPPPSAPTTLVPTPSPDKPLAPAALKAWYEAYKAAYGENERTLDHAWDRAKGAFPDKLVTRASVRALMPGGKPGPKSKK